MADQDSNAASGVEVRGYRRGTLSTDSWDQYVIPTTDRIVSFRGRCTSFITPGRAAVGQKIMAIHNATGSSVLININRIKVDILSTAVKAVTIITPMIRIVRFTALPTNGTVLTKVAIDTTMTSNVSATLWGDASADGTLSATTLTITPSGGTLAQTQGPRVFTAVGYEPIDTGQFFYGESDITVRALEGIAIFLDQAVVTTGNPATDRWTASIDWEEYTRP